MIKKIKPPYHYQIQKNNYPITSHSHKYSSLPDLLNNASIKDILKDQKKSQNLIRLLFDANKNGNLYPFMEALDDAKLDLNNLLTLLKNHTYKNRDYVCYLSTLNEITEKLKPEAILKNRDKTIALAELLFKSIQSTQLYCFLRDLFKIGFFMDHVVDILKLYQFDKEYAQPLVKLILKKSPRDIFEDKDLAKEVLLLMHSAAQNNFLHLFFVELQAHNFYFEDLIYLLSLEISGSGKFLSGKPTNPMFEAASCNRIIPAIKALYYAPSFVDFVEPQFKLINIFNLLKVTGGEGNPKSALHAIAENHHFPQFLKLFFILYQKADMPFKKIKIFVDLFEFFTNKSYYQNKTTLEILIKNGDFILVLETIGVFMKNRSEDEIFCLQQISKSLFDLFVDENKKQKGIHLIAETNQLTPNIINMAITLNLISKSALLELLAFQNEEGNTPLHLAYRYFEGIKTGLLKHSVSNKDWNKLINIKNINGKTPLDFFFDNIEEEEKFFIKI